MTDQQIALECLRQIDPCQLDYQGWLNVGMALHYAGSSVTDWETWSRRDTKRFKEKECGIKWAGFRGSGKPVTVGTLVQYCKDQGGRIVFNDTTNDTGRTLDWDDEISSDKDERYIRTEWLQDSELPAPAENWDGTSELIKYLSAVFLVDENIGYVTESYQNEDGKFLPRKGCWDRTAGQLIEALSKSKGDIGAVIGDCKPECGAWIRFNPMDGKGCRDENVTAFRHCLVESDSIPLERQFAIYKELELPITALVHSGGKSVHAIVKIDAPDMTEYRKRVDFLYQVCKKSGLEIDKQNRNPSRLSRMPGVTRNGNKQYLVATEIGKSSWTEWREWVEAINDDLPDVISLADIWNNLPPLAEPVINDILRTGHKLLLAGPSKAGKSYLQLQLCIAVAEGRKWLGWQCKQGHALYVNLELDPISCPHRLKDVYTAMNCSPNNIANIDIWNLRGKSMPLDKLAPKLIRRASKKKYTIIVIDPIYKIITGDENSANEMANFCNQFDKICSELGTAVIYCHHHSKGAQGAKRAADRASGSGVFARDPDACIDLIELELDSKRRKTIADRFACEKIESFLNKTKPDWKLCIGPDESIVLGDFMGCIQKEFTADIYNKAAEIVKQINQVVETLTAWRIEGTLREFPAFKPKRLFFLHPTHVLDKWDLLRDARAEGELPTREIREKAVREKIDKTKSETLSAFDNLSGFDDKPVTVKAMAEFLNIDEDNVRRRLKKAGLSFKNGIVSKSKKEEEDCE